jgi:hypothetical protein
VCMTHLRSCALDLLPGAYLPSVDNLRRGSTVLSDAETTGHRPLARAGWTSTCRRTRESHPLGFGLVPAHDADDS